MLLSRKSRIYSNNLRVKFGREPGLFVKKLKDMDCDHAKTKTHSQTAGNILLDKGVFMFENIPESFNNQEKTKPKSENIDGNWVKITAAGYSFICQQLNFVGYARKNSG
jgi:hypothetical protein